MTGQEGRADSMASDSESRTNPGLASRPARARSIVALGILGTLLAASWVVWNAGRDKRFDGRGGLSAYLDIARDVPAAGRFPGDPYIGSIACAECHPGEYALFTGSGHALTFRKAAERRVADELAGTSVADPEQKEVRWTYEKKNGQFLIGREEAGKLEQRVADYALGSGHHATTFVTVLDLDQIKILEHRLTYYTREHELKTTPGQKVEDQDAKATPWGREVRSSQARKCFRCHATQLSAHDDSVIDPRSMIPNVSCERCHGPGRAHVAAARRGAPEKELTMPMGLGQWTVDSQLELCGKCHRHPSRVSPDRITEDDPALVRFQPIGLSQSKCFRGSDGGLSCVSCHDPHARATHDFRFYEKVCMRCHRSSKTGLDEGEERTAPVSLSGPACPVSPARGCVSCHMPKVDSGQHVLFTDHWIRVHRVAVKAQPAGIERP
jgi:hypothetical protein